MGKFSAPPCGLFCGDACDDYAKGWCHGCGCDCGKCHGLSGRDWCEVFQCSHEKGLEHCGLCNEFPCTKTVGLCFDPVWDSHRPLVENLKLRARIGTKRWVEEQERLWSDPERRKAIVAMLSRCKARQARIREGSD